MRKAPTSNPLVAATEPDADGGLRWAHETFRGVDVAQADLIREAIDVSVVPVHVRAGGRFGSFWRT